MSNQDDNSFDGLDGVAVLAIFVIMFLIVGFNVLTHKEPITEKFQVTTKAGEVFEFDAKHHCGKHYRKAAQQAFGVQDTRLNDLSIKMLPAVVSDLTRIHDGNIKEGNRCEILKNEVKAIKRLPKPPEG